MVNDKYLHSEYNIFIDGESVPAVDNKTLSVINPSTEEVIAEVAAGDKQDIELATQAAKDAYKGWSSLQPKERSRILYKVSQRIRREAEAIATLLTYENGKPFSNSLAGVESCARYFEYYAGAADKNHGDSIPLGENSVDFTVRESYGVFGHILAWNGPVEQVGRSVGPCLAAGNTAVIKPAEQCPMSTLVVAELAADAGLPPGALNVVVGTGPEAGEPLASSSQIDGLSFTGSADIGRHVSKQAVDNLNPVHVEAGGNNPNVVYPDADLNEAVRYTIISIFRFLSGQVCSAGDRLIIHEDIHDEFVKKLVEETKQLTVGPGIEDPAVGPIISEVQYENVLDTIEAAKAEIGDPVIGGEVTNRSGFFIEPTIFTGVTRDSALACEETFGPVLSVLTFSDEKEAIEIANDTEYGLVAGVFTSSIDRANRFAKEVQAGQIYINQWYGGGEETPFGGYKNSGMGREKGLEAMRTYTQVKNVYMKVEDAIESDDATAFR